MSFEIHISLAEYDALPKFTGLGGATLVTYHGTQYLTSAFTVHHPTVTVDLHNGSQTSKQWTPRQKRMTMLNKMVMAQLRQEEQRT